LNWVHIWQVSCILLGSTLSKSSWVVISQRWWILSSVMKCEGELINMTQARDKEKFWVSDRNRTHDLANTSIES